MDDGGGRWQRTRTARKIGRWTTTGKVRSGWQTMTGLSIRDGEDVVFDGGHMVLIIDLEEPAVGLPSPTWINLEEP